METYSVDASGAEGAKGGGKKAERPKPRPAYRGRR
jgi:hypothetical protein